MFSKRKFACLGAMTLVLVGCNEKSESERLTEHAALVTTCRPDIRIYQWQDKLYFRESSSYEFRRIIATLDDVCAKFNPEGTASRK